MCSYAGKIHPRPHDNQLSYVGGETKILAVDRNVKFSALLTKLIALCDCDAISFKYQLPGEDLDALISVTNDDDLDHMMHEYDRLCRISPKPARLRLFVFPNQNPTLNSPPVNSVDFLFGFEKANAAPQPVVERIQDLHTRKSDDTDKQQEKIPQVAVPGNWEDKQVPMGVYPASNINKEQVYMILAPASTQMIRPANGPPTQGYYVYRDQQPMYNMITPMIMPQHKAGGYSTGAGRHIEMVYYGVMGKPEQYQGMGADMRVPAAEAGGKAVAKAT